MPAAVAPRYADLIPFRAGHLTPLPEAFWSEYDVATRRSALRESLQRLAALGARQVVIEAPYAFTTEPVPDKAYDGFATGNVIYKGPRQQQGGSIEYGDCQRGDMGLVPFAPPLSWTDTRRAVHSPFSSSDARQPFPGPFQALPGARPITVTFSADWDGGSVDISGTDANGVSAREIFPATPGGTLRGTTVFSRISSAQKARTGSTGTAQIGYVVLPEDLNNRAAQSLQAVMQLAGSVGLKPVLSARYYASPAHAAECRPCQADSDCAAPNRPFLNATCVYERASDAEGRCRAPAGDSLYLDPSRDLGQFFTAMTPHVESLARLAQGGGASLLVLGGGAPYLSGGGQATFADNSNMNDRRAALGQGFRQLIAAARAVLRSGTGAAPLLSYSAQNLLFEGRPLASGAGGGALPEWRLIDFWDDLDVISVDFYQPARGSSVSGADRGDMAMRDMLRYMETHNLQTDGIGSVADLEAFGQARGAGFASRPILLLRDGVHALSYAAAAPQVAPPRPGVAPDFDEQARFVEARLLLAGQAVQRGIIGGIGLHAFPANVSSSAPGYGGAKKAFTRGRGFDNLADYLGLFDTPAETVIGTYWSAQYRTRP